LRRAEPGEPTVLKDMFSRSFLAVDRPGVAMSAPPSQPVRRCGRITTSGVPKSKMVVSADSSSMIVPSIVLKMNGKILKFESGFHANF
jgi:hypothetical protein